MDFNQAPLLLIWEVTRGCALACRHCRASAMDFRDPLELSLAEGKKLLDDTKAMGTPLVIFTGGDPLQRPDLEELIRYAKQIGLRAGSIPAETPRLTRERVAGLQAAGLDQMALSIDGPTAVQHDAFRGVPGCFDVAMKAAQWAHEVGLPLQVNTVFARWNADQFEALAQLVIDLKIVFWEVFFLVPTGRGTELESCTIEQHEALFAKLYALSRRVDFIIKVTEAPQYRAFVALQERQQAPAAGPAGEGPAALGSFHHKAGGRASKALMGINSGKGFCFVDHVGNVCPSGFLPLVAGNVRQQTVTEIYRNHPVFRELRDASRLRGMCGQCEFRELCGGSRARAYSMTGDYLAPEPFCRFGPAVPADTPGAPAHDATRTPVGHPPR